MPDQAQKQYQLILAHVQEFKDGKLQIGRFIELLDGSINLLQTIEPTQGDMLRGEWWDLEQIYVVAIDRRQIMLSAEEQELVFESVRNIEQLLHE